MATEGVSTPQMTSDSNSPTKTNRPRRRKRPARNTAHDNTHDANKKDGLDLQDDEKWTFLPQALLQSIAERDQDVSPPTRRVTRSMGNGANDTIDYSSNLEEPLAENIAQSIDKKDKGMDEAVDLIDDSHLGSEDKSSIKSERKKQDGSNKDTSHCSEEKPLAETAVQSIVNQDEAININDVDKEIGTIDYSSNLEAHLAENAAQSIDMKDKVMGMDDVVDLSDDSHFSKQEESDKRNSKTGLNSSEEKSLAEIAVQIIVNQYEAVKNNEETDATENTVKLHIDKAIDCSSKLEKQLAENVVQIDMKDKVMGMDGVIDLTDDSRLSSEDKPIAKSDQRKQDESHETENKTDSNTNTAHCSEHKSIAKSIANQGEAVESNDETDAMENTAKSHIDKEIYTVVKTRQRCEYKETVRIMFTGITPSQRHMQMIESIGAELVDSIRDAHKATHAIVTDGETTLRRTPKLMICMCRTENILGMGWLEASAKEQKILCTDNFLLLNNREAEKRYGFSMKETISLGILARRKKGGVLGGWSVYVCSGVAGNKAPNMKEMQLIIEAAGGQVLKSALETKCEPQFGRPNSNAFFKVIVLTSDPSTASQLKERGVSRFEGLGAKILSTTWLFQTIITQRNIFDIDVEDDVGSPSAYDLEPRIGLVRRNSLESLSSTLSAMSTSPVKRGTFSKGFRPVANMSPQSKNAARNDDHSVRSTSTRGSRVSCVERAPVPPSTSSKLQRRKLKFEETKASNFPIQPQTCTNYATRETFISFHLRMLVDNTLSTHNGVTADNEAASQTHSLWLDYFNKVSSCESTITKPSHSKTAVKPTNRLKKRGIRCMRGRKRSSSISPLVSSTILTDTTTMSAKKKPSLSATTRKLLVEDNPYVTWESYVLFTLALRSEKLGFHESLASKAILPANCLFPLPVEIASYGIKKQGSKLSLNVEARQHHEVFGTLATVFAIHLQHQSSGMISEHVLAMLALQAIEVVSVMHACGIVHNRITLDSFLVVRRLAFAGKKTRRKKAEDDAPSWFLQLTEFGYRARVLNCQQQQHCQEAQHYAYDYQCLANVIHVLLTGGNEISLNTSSIGPDEFSSKAFLKGNLFLRGAVCWCSILDSLMCVGESNHDRDGKSIPLRLQHPVDTLNISDDDGEFLNLGGSCRVLQELSDNTCLDDFMEGLCTHNKRYIVDTNRAIFVCSSNESSQPFVCYRSSEQTVEQLMQKESKLQVRETEIQEKVAQFEKSKAEQQSIMERESKVGIKEKEVLQRERAYALKVQQLERMKEDLCLRESRLEHELHALKQSAQNEDCDASLTHPISIQHRGRNADHMTRSHENCEVKARTTPAKKSGRKRKSSDDPEPNQAPRYSRLLAGDTPQETKRRWSKRDDSPNSGQKYNEHVCKKLNDKPSTSPKNVFGQIQRKRRNLQPSYSDHSDTESECQLEDLHGQSQESYESTSNIKRKMRESRKSPKCSLHNLPTQTKQQSISSRKRPPRSPPKKVFIDLGED